MCLLTLLRLFSNRPHKILTVLNQIYFKSDAKITIITNDEFSDGYYFYVHNIEKALK
jgi:hypothetical protein